jgi:WD40 repeat protein
VLTVAHDREGSRIATGSQDKTARIWDAESRRELLLLKHDAAVVSVGLSPDGECLVTADVKRSIRIWDAENGNLLRETSIKKWPTHVQFSGNDQVLITSSDPFVLSASDISPVATEPSSLSPRFPQPSYQRWEWTLSDSDPPKPMKGDVWLSTTAHNVLVGKDGTVRLTTPDVLSANEGEESTEGELALPPRVNSPIKFVSLKFGNNRLSTLSTDGTVQVAAVSPLDWADLVRDAKKTVAAWDEDLQQLSPEERKRLGLEERP